MISKLRTHGLEPMTKEGRLLTVVRGIKLGTIVLERMTKEGRLLTLASRSDRFVGGYECNLIYMAFLTSRFTLYLE